MTLLQVLVFKYVKGKMVSSAVQLAALLFFSLIALAYL